MEGNVSGYVCNHGSPNGERDTASPRLWAMLRTQASDEEDVLYWWCILPTGGGQQVVFLHMYLQTRVTLRAFPVATPRGRSVSFPIRGTMVTYVTWDVFWHVFRISTSCDSTSLFSQFYLDFFSLNVTSFFSKFDDFNSEMVYFFFSFFFGPNPLPYIGTFTKGTVYICMWMIFSVTTFPSHTIKSSESTHNSII